MNLRPPPSSFISDRALEAALDWLRDNARKIGLAKYRLVKAEHMRGVVRALEMKKHAELGVAAQEREANASDAYKAAVLEEAKAAGLYEMMRAQRVACEAKIECWRSEQANFRAMKI